MNFIHRLFLCLGLFSFVLQAQGASRARTCVHQSRRHRGRKPVDGQASGRPWIRPSPGRARTGGFVDATALSPAAAGLAPAPATRAEAVGTGAAPVCWQIAPSLSHRAALSQPQL